MKVFHIEDKEKDIFERTCSHEDKVLFIIKNNIFLSCLLCGMELEKVEIINIKIK